MCKVAAGSGEPLQIVCGAPNARAGLKAPLAKIGAKLPNGAEIRQAALRGIDSHGMLCSAKELGIDDDASGLLSLDPSLEPGTPLREALALDDTLITLKITPNRADCLSIAGLAQDVAAVTGAPLALSEFGATPVTFDGVRPVRVEDPEGCPRFAGRLIDGIRTRTIPVWMLLGGACGALTVSTQGVVAGVLGVSLFTVGVVAGQTLHGLLLDRIGFGPAGVVAVTPGRVVGGALALLAVGISIGGDVLREAPVWLLVLPVLAGAGIAWQAGANGRLAKTVSSPIAATLMSFIAGTSVLVVAAAVSVAVRGLPAALPAEPWLYVGGLLGFVYIMLGAFLVAHTGVLLMGLGSVLGQLSMSILIDLLWPTVGRPALWQLLAMVVVAFASVFAALPRRRR